MGTSTGGESGTSSGGITQQQPTGQRLPPSTNSSTPPSTGPTTSRLLTLFKECVDHGVWASLETVERRGIISVEFCCRLQSTGCPAPLYRRQNRPNAKKRQRNAERTRGWRDSRQQQRPHPPSNSAPDTVAPPVADSATVNGPSPLTGSPTAARSFAVVAAQPAREVMTKPTPTAASAVKTAKSAAAGARGSKARGTHPVKRAKSTLASSRVSQRAALLTKKRALTTAETETPLPFNTVEEESAPEVLRGTDGETALDISLDLSSPTPPPSRPPLSPLEEKENSYGGNRESEEGAAATPSSPPPLPKNCNCTTVCEEDFHNEKWEDGLRLNTCRPSWKSVFFKKKGKCRFCKEDLPPGQDDEDECNACEDLSTFELVLKYAPRWRYYAY